MNFELVPRVQALRRLRVANVYTLLGARLNDELGNVVFFVKQQLRGRV